MRVLIDTNVLISAAFNPDGVLSQAYKKVASYPNRGLICEQNKDFLESGVESPAIMTPAVFVSRI